MTMSQYWADLEQQEYDPDEFVERLAFRCVEIRNKVNTHRYILDHA